ncbi:MAG: hypothetical protein WEC15_00690, partial [Flavobacteriales bacterium]
MAMRPVLTLLLALGILAAQAIQPDLAVVFVDDSVGRPMPGAYATPIAAQAWLGTRRAPAWTVEMHFTVSKQYPYGDHEIGTHKSWPLSPDTVRAGRQRHLRFSILDCFCVDQYLVVISDGDKMRVDIPSGDTDRGHLVHGMVARSGAIPSPEVIRFMPGRFNFVNLAEDPSYHEVEDRIAQRLIRNAGKRTKRKAPSVPEPVTREPKRKLNSEPAELVEARGPAKSSGRTRTKLVAMRGDTAVLILTGRVTLDGGCSNNLPMMALEFRGKDAWEELIPMPSVQMDRGLPVVEWRKHELRIPLGEWMRRHGPQSMPLLH